MSGYENWNYNSFFCAEERLKLMGYTNILNPASNPKDPDGHSWEEFMKDGITTLLKADAAMFLNGWQKSKGARLEMAIAKSLGMPTFDENGEQIDADGNIERPWLPDQKPCYEETVCHEADRLVSGDRGDAYGHPMEDFSKTGRMWGAILSHWAERTWGKEPVPPDLVGLCMMALKMSREAHKPKRDNRVDIAGYAKCVDMIQSKMALGAT